MVIKKISSINFYEKIFINFTDIFYLHIIAGS